MTKAEYADKCDDKAADVEERAVILAAVEKSGEMLSPEQKEQCDKLDSSIEFLSEQISQYEDLQSRLKKSTADKLDMNRPRLSMTTTSTPGVVATLQITPVRYGGKLRSFKGPDAEKDAHLCGQFFLSKLGDPEVKIVQKARLWCRDNLAMSEGQNTDGGAIVPPEFSRAIIDLREEYGVFRRESKVETMVSDSKSVPRRLSGLTAYYVGENTAITASDKKWNTVNLVAKKLAVLAKYSSELNEDSIISMADDLAQEAAYAFSLAEDQAGFIGDGTSTYGGITGLTAAVTTATASVVTAVSGNISFETLDLGDFESCIGKLPQYADNFNAKWFISKVGWAASMLRLIDAAGGNTGAMIAGAAPKQFLGYPVVISQVLNSTLGSDTSALKCFLGNLRQASTMGDRRGITVKTSEHRYIELDQFAIQVTERYDIVIHDVGTTSVVGSVIGLKTNSS